MSHWSFVLRIQEKYMADMKARLKDKQQPHDVTEAEDLLKQHKDLYDDMQANRGRYAGWRCESIYRLCQSRRVPFCKVA